jgi:2-amino-4-hydroxy-6-hydroxymethyldihydropteridine diphosphokinase
MRDHKRLAVPQTVIAYVGLGANIGEPVHQLTQALSLLSDIEGTQLRACSSLYRSTPVGCIDQPDFINAVAALETRLSPQALLSALGALEMRFGRVRGPRDAPRPLDLDILLMGNIRMRTPQLSLPHPRAHQRAFVLIPLQEIAPTLEIPGKGSVSALLSHCTGQTVMRIDDPPRNLPHGTLPDTLCRTASPVCTPLSEKACHDLSCQ